jgi:chromosome segregation ATPase
MQLHAAPHPGAPDGIPSLLATLRDVTESRRLEQSLVEAMAKQSEQEAAHEAERARLAAELAEARKLGHAAEVTEIAALERKLAEAAEMRSQLAAQHAAEVEGLTEALDERTRISDEQAARLNAAAATEARLKAELADAVARHDAAVKEGASAREALEGARSSAENAVQEVTARFEADVQALKDALNQAMEDQAQLAQSAASHEQAAGEARARVEELERAIAELKQSTSDTIRTLEGKIADLDRDLAAASAAQRDLDAAHNARLAQVEAALAGSRDAEQMLTARFAALAETAKRVAHEARSLASAAAASAAITAQALASRIEQPLKDVLGAEIALTLAVAAPDSLIAVPVDRVEQALVALAVNRGAAMRSGQIVLEIADVSVDADAAKGHGGISPGEYALVAVHVAGEGAADGLPGPLFESADAGAWSRAEAELGGAHEATRASGGMLWLSREGKGVVFELYLPRQTREAQ